MDIKRYESKRHKIQRHWDDWGGYVLIAFGIAFYMLALHWIIHKAY